MNMQKKACHLASFFYIHPFTLGTESKRKGVGRLHIRMIVLYSVS